MCSLCPLRKKQTKIVRFDSYVDTISYLEYASTCKGDDKIQDDGEKQGNESTIYYGPDIPVGGIDPLSPKGTFIFVGVEFALQFKLIPVGPFHQVSWLRVIFHLGESRDSELNRLHKND
ncbi:hypothetical protein CEXT_425731 [Caerostris extrusa]|uniref:Uncharacterized protein n=1 Tax=Caerostris extrusa TaxID=172846 RepID=A0AAV4XUD7_CAEEX|nr:hypothetical protein CEXT_425731 [Caerostris extrusa]